VLICWVRSAGLAVETDGEIEMLDAGKLQVGRAGYNAVRQTERPKYWVDYRFTSSIHVVTDQRLSSRTHRQ
jgi:hypothetical protein